MARLDLKRRPAWDSHLTKICKDFCQIFFKGTSIFYPELECACWLIQAQWLPFLMFNIDMCETLPQSSWIKFHSVW